MNLSALTPRQWAYVLHRIEHPDDEPLPHPGNPRKQNLDRIADQISEQLDRDELQTLRDMAAGKRPRALEYDEAAGRDLDAEPVDDAALAEPLADREADSARAFQPAQRLEVGARKRTQAAAAALENPAADGASGSEGAPEAASSPSTEARSPDTSRPERAERSVQRYKRPAVAAEEIPQLPESHVRTDLQPMPSASPPEPLPPRAAAVLQPRLF